MSNIQHEPTGVNSLKILFITDNFPPEVNAPANRTYEHCKEWVKQGSQVTIITCAPNFPHGKVYKGYKNKLYQKEQMDGIQVIRVWSFITKNARLRRRILDYFSFAFCAFWVGLFQKQNIIIATSPQFFTTWAAWGISKIRKTPWIFELRDLWPESIKSVGVMKQNNILSWLEKIELGLYKDADKVIAVSPAFKSNLINRGIRSEKINIITNGVNLTRFNKCRKNSKLLTSLDLHGKFILGYIGTHGMAHNLDFIIQSISFIKDPSIHFLFIGDGAMKKKVVSLSKKKQLINVTFLDSITQNDVPRYLSIIDVSLVPLKKSETFKAVIPSKIFEAAGMQKPILLGVEGQAKEIIEQYDAGLCYEPENQLDFHMKLQDIRMNTRYAELQKGCAKLALDYNRKTLSRNMLTIVQNLQNTSEIVKPRSQPVHY